MKAKISVGQMLIFQAVPVVLAPLYYYALVRSQFGPLDRALQYAIAAIIGGALAVYWLLAKDIQDERALANKRRAGEVCFQAALVLLVAALLLIGFELLPLITLGYLIAFGLAGLALLNVALFYAFERQGG